MEDLVYAAHDDNLLIVSNGNFFGNRVSHPSICDNKELPSF